MLQRGGGGAGDCEECRSDRGRITGGKGQKFLGKEGARKGREGRREQIRPLGLFPLLGERD